MERTLALACCKWGGQATGEHCLRPHLDLEQLACVVIDSSAAVGSQTAHIEVLRRACDQNAYAHFVDCVTGAFRACTVSIGVVR